MNGQSMPVLDSGALGALLSALWTVTNDVMTPSDRNVAIIRASNRRSFRFVVPELVA